LTPKKERGGEKDAGGVREPGVMLFEETIELVLAEPAFQQTSELTF
jgi:hypothetical protein